MILSRLMDIADVVRAAEHNATVARLIDGNVIVGTARSVGDDRGCALHRADVETLFLRVTSLAGFEHFWPVADLATERRAGLFVPDYQEVKPA